MRRCACLVLGAVGARASTLRRPATSLARTAVLPLPVNRICYKLDSQEFRTSRFYKKISNVISCLMICCKVVLLALGPLPGRASGDGGAEAAGTLPAETSEFDP